ncbi:MAG: aminotransferase class V-fold PLP-dependent enzyme [Eubacterium sp.]|nr:aminotransferase class V-fold PLP-dependent enzyme [Eubacterium sp.]
MLYLDNAATTLQKPSCVIDAMVEAMNRAGNAARGVNAASLYASRLVTEAREELADLFDFSNPNRVCFTCNATEALNTVIKGFFRQGDHVITTAMEHNSVLRPLACLQDEGRIDLSVLEADGKGRISYEELEHQVQKETRAIVIQHASNVTGNVNDLHRIGEICRRKNIALIVDAAQTAGSIPISMKNMNIAVLCFTGHKGMMGPQGTGGLLVRKDIDITPLKEGGSGIHSYDKRQPKDYPEHLEAGTLNTHGIAGLLAAVRFLKETGVEQIGSHETALAHAFYEMIRDIPNIKIYGDFEGARTGVVSLNIEGYESGEVADEMMERFEIAARSGAHCAPLAHQTMGTVDTGAVRFSFSYFNTMEDARAAAEAVRLLATE